MIDRRSLEIRRRKGILMCKRYCHSLTDKSIGFLGTTPVTCSCWMCGNPRRHGKGKCKYTLQELRQSEKDSAIRDDVYDAENRLSD